RLKAGLLAANRAGRRQGDRGEGHAGMKASFSDLKASFSDLWTSFTDIREQARLAARALREYGDHLFHPAVRLGVTGMAGAGKTVFITALVHALLRGGRFPVFEALASGRLARAC